MPGHRLERHINPSDVVIAPHVLPEIGELQRSACEIGEPLQLRIAVAADIQHQPAYGVRRVAAIAEQLVESLVARLDLVLAEGGDQIEKRLEGNLPLLHSLGQSDKNGMAGLPPVA